MATLLVRDLPDDLLARFKCVAKAQHRSVPAETIHLIEQAVRDFDLLETRRQALARIAQRREHLLPTPPDEPDSLTLLREDRSR